MEYANFCGRKMGFLGEFIEKPDRFASLEDWMPG